MPPFTGLALGLGRRDIKGFLLPIGTLWPQRRKNRTLNLFSLLVYRVLRAISPVIMKS